MYVCIVLDKEDEKEEKKEKEEEELITDPALIYADRLKKLRDILSGTTSIRLYMHFLYQHNQTDLNILQGVKVNAVYLLIMYVLCVYIYVYVYA